MNRLIANSPPLDPNSVYCNLLQCSHFSDTCICAKTDGKLIGFVSGYLLPAKSDTLFVWQVVVAEEARGQGLASRMLTALVERPACRDIRHIETTITPDNAASQALFSRLADTLSTKVVQGPGFDRKLHFDGRHESEELWRIGPIHQ
ncbi:MAG: diaminobutyrate acetyltransferase [Pontiellaceae bacterium]|nr:diaminobutyrate acetyltransferase [Pontiellaceae bacterium]MBN2784937.1 diaminobutyrate acetyltransferase [Pontiellaceae bacterium]